MLVVLSVGIAGCGSGGEASSATSATTSVSARTPIMSKRQAVARANAVCAKRNRELKATTPPGAGLHQIVVEAFRRAAIERRALIELERLGQASHATAEWRAVLIGTAARLRATEKLASLARSPASFKEQMALANQPQIALLIAARHNGLSRCATVASPSIR